MSERDLQFFRRDLSKDERDWLDPEPAGRQAFRKDCLSPWRAEQEAAALRHLAREQGRQTDGNPDPLAPRLVGQQGRHLWLEPLRGIRLYDLIRLLEACAAQESTAVIQALLERSRGRLERLQRHLQDWQGPAGLHPYPLGRKVAGLVHLLSRLLELPPLSAELRQELRQLSQQWRGWAVLPFRDATSKNVLVLIPELDPAHGDLQQLAWLQRQLQRWPVQRWQQLPLRDLDFSSLLHSTVPEDDPISLLAHQRTLPYSSLRAADLVLLPERYGIEPERAALGLLVRWLRFGGRKLAYRLLHPEACSRRFRHDDPLPYFSTLRRQLSQEEHQVIYTKALAELCRNASTAGVRFALVDIATFLGGPEAALEAVQQRICELRPLWQEGLADGVERLASARRNLVPKGVEDLSGLPPEAWEARVAEAALGCWALESLEERRAFNRGAGRIQISHRRGRGLQLHLSSCHTSTLQPWVGSGYLEADGQGGWRPRILANAQVQQWLTLPPYGPKQMPGLRRLGIL